MLNIEISTTIIINVKLFYSKDDSVLGIFQYDIRPNILICTHQFHIGVEDFIIIFNYKINCPYTDNFARGEYQNNKMESLMSDVSTNILSLPKSVLSWRSTVFSRVV